MFGSEDEENLFAGLVQEIIACIEALPVDEDWAQAVLFGLGLHTNWSGHIAGAAFREWDDYRRSRAEINSGRILWLCCSNLYFYVRMPQAPSERILQVHVFSVIDSCMRDPRLPQRAKNNLVHLERLLHEFDREYRKYDTHADTLGRAATQAPNAHTLSMLLTRLEGIHDGTDLEEIEEIQEKKEFKKEQFLTDVEYLYEHRYITPETLNMLKRTSKSTKAMVEKWKLPCKVKVRQAWFGEQNEGADRLLGQKIQALQALHPILELDLSGIPIMLDIIGPELARCADLTRLNLSGIRPLFRPAADETELSHVFASTKIIQTLMDRTKLTHLDLSSTDFDDGCAYLFARMLPQVAKALTHLNLSTDQPPSASLLWSEKAKVTLIRADFPALVDLDLTGLPFNDQQAEALREAWGETGRPPEGLHL